MLRIRFARRGKRHRPTYRVVVIERHRATDGKFVDDLGSYDPHSRQYRLDLEKVHYWTAKGAQPTHSVASLIDAAGSEGEGVRARRDGFDKKNKKQKKAEEEAKEAAQKEAEEKKAAEAAANEAKNDGASDESEAPSEEAADAPKEAGDEKKDKEPAQDSK